jgi:hypothetical protein
MKDKKFWIGITVGILIGIIESMCSVFQKELHDKMSHILSIDLSWTIPFFKYLLLAAFVYCLTYVFTYKQTRNLSNTSNGNDEIQQLKNDNRILNNRLYILTELSQRRANTQLYLMGNQPREKGNTVDYELSELGKFIQSHRTELTGKEVNDMILDFKTMKVK